MIRVTIECEGVKATVEQETAITSSDAITLCEQALLGVGFLLEGTLDIVSVEDETHEAND